MPSSGISFSDREQNNAAAAQNGFRRLLERLVILYTHGESSLISESELARLLNSLCYVLRLEEAGEEALAGLASRPDAFYARRLEALEAQMERLLAQWREICALMPPIRNVSLRDTLASIGQVKSMYDMRFAAHEVPCDIQYQLSEPVDERLQGLDSWRHGWRSFAGKRSGLPASPLKAALPCWKKRAPITVGCM